MSERSKPTVSIAAGEGGTGRTLFATSLAVALTEIRRVLKKGGVFLISDF